MLSSAEVENVRTIGRVRPFSSAATKLFGSRVKGSQSRNAAISNPATVGLTEVETSSDGSTTSHTATAPVVLTNAENYVEDDHRVASMPSRRGILKVKSQIESVSQPWNLASTKSSNDNETSVPSVRFDIVSIHHHYVRLGDNPSVSIGPPLSIEWVSFESFTLPVDKYEQTKPEPRDRVGMLLPLREREAKLINAGFSRMEMATASRLAQQIKMARRQSAKDGRFQKLFQRFTRSSENDLNI